VNCNYLNGGMYPLNIASQNGNFEVAQFLLNSGASVEAKGPKDWTSLHHACFSGQVEIVDLLIQCNSNVNVQEATKDSTPLHLALDCSVRPVSADLCRLLLQSGAKASARDIRLQLSP